jgi:hypothetical protein
MAASFQDTTAEDTMVVQFILASRMGYRELESDEEDSNAFEVPRDQVPILPVVTNNGLQNFVIQIFVTYIYNVTFYQYFLVGQVFFPPNFSVNFLRILLK